MNILKEGAFTLNNDQDNRSMGLASEDREHNSKTHL